MYSGLLMSEPLTSIERRLLAVEQDNAPAGHAISGPAQAPPFWRCSCGLEWSDGTHRNAQAAQAKPSGPEREWQYPFDA